jgi:peptidylprolyl isomerase
MVYMKKMCMNPLTIFLMVALTSLGCSSKYAGFDKTASGLYYKLYKVSVDTVKAMTGDYIYVDMRYLTEADSLLFDTRSNPGQKVRFQLPPSDFQGDIYEGIRMMSPGDSAVFLINSDSLFTKTFKMQKRPDFIDSNSVVKFYIVLHSSESLKTMQAKESETVRKYLESNGINEQPLSSGLYFVETVTGTGNKIDSGSVVKLHFTLSLASGDPVFSSYERGEPLQMTYGKPFDTPGLDQGIALMKKGGKAKLIVPSTLAFGSAGRGSVIPPFTALVYDVEVVDVMSKAQFDKQEAAKKQQAEQQKATSQKDEMLNLQKYLVQNKITIKPNQSGLYYIETLKGSGARAVPGKRVKVHYTGKLLDGTKFDSSVDRGEPFGFTLGKGQVIKGWDEGIGLMNVGGKATLIIPSSIAYGDRDMGTIPPYSTLVFDVELLEVE